ncbi:MAG: hypothetical protein ACK506_16925 [Pirellula sp.]
MKPYKAIRNTMADLDAQALLEDPMFKSLSRRDSVSLSFEAIARASSIKTANNDSRVTAICDRMALVRSTSVEKTELSSNMKVKRQ